MNVHEIVKLYNEGMTLVQLSEKVGKSKSTLQRFIVTSGYKRNSKTGKYEFVVFDENNDSNTNETNDEQEKLVSRTYALSEKLDRAIKIKSAIEGVRAVDIVRKALDSYIEDKYFNM